MPSPFPGMDPFIEASGRWQGFHTHLLTTCQNQLLWRLPSNYDADIEERVQLVDQGDRSARSFRPDIFIQRRIEAQHAAGSRTAVADLPPVTLHSPVIETESTGYIEIRTLSTKELVTVIEVLLPTNKKEPDRTIYLTKMEQFRQAGVHLVEIDLLLDGLRLEAIEPLPAGDFYTFVRRLETYPMCDVYGWSIRRKLPTIPIPLKQTDGEVALDLDEAFKSAFDRGGYSRRLEYNIPLRGNLSDADRQWAKSVVTKA